MQVLHHKAGGATNGAKSLMLLILMEEEWAPTVLKTWAPNTIYGSLETKVGGEQVQLGTFSPIKYKVFWHGRKTELYWGLFPVLVQFEPWVIAPNVLLASGYVRRNLLNKDKFHLWD